MSLLRAIKHQLGLSVTPTNNFTLTAEADNGTMKLARGNAGATTQDIMTVDAAGKVAFPQGLSYIGACLVAEKTTTQTVNSGTQTVVAPFNAATLDTQSGFNATTGRYTPTKAGWYMVLGQVRYNAVFTASVVEARILKNGSLIRETVGQTTSSPYMEVTALVYCNGTSDYVELYAYHNKGSSTTIQGQLHIAYLG